MVAVLVDLGEGDQECNPCEAVFELANYPDEVRQWTLKLVNLAWAYKEHEKFRDDSTVETLSVAYGEVFPEGFFQPGDDEPGPGPI